MYAAPDGFDLADLKTVLVENVEGEAAWREMKGHQNPDDVRNLRCAEALRDASMMLNRLPSEHRLFIKYAWASQLGMESWTEIETNFLSRWGFFQNKTPADSEFRFVAEFEREIDEFIASREEVDSIP